MAVETIRPDLPGRRDHATDAARADLRGAGRRPARRHPRQSVLDAVRLVDAARPNPALRWVLLGVSSFLALALLVPFARRLFRFAPLHLTDLLLSLGVGFVCACPGSSS